MKPTNSGRYANLLSFIDLLFNLMLGFAAMFLLSLILITKQKVNEESIKKDAIYIVRIEWQGDHDSDVDLWLLDGKGNAVGYRAKQSPDMYLERDNVGADYDRMYPGHINEEIISIRGVNDGWYTMNVHWYQKRNDDRQPEVKWSIIKLKPSMQTKATGTIYLDRKGLEKTVARFRVDKENNEIIELDTKTQFMFVIKRLLSGE